MHGFCRVLVLMIVGTAAQGAFAEDLRPGMALPPDQLTADAARYERLLQGDESPASDTLLQGEDTGENRRQFDDRLVHFGLSLRMARATPAAGLFSELDVWDRLVIGTEAALSLWGPAAAVYLRGRPLVWGGRGRGLLNALTVQTEYRYMAYGDESFGLTALLCHADCDRPSFIDMPAHFVVLEAGFEHAFAGGFSLRYAWGAAFELTQPAWRCRVGRQLAPCADEQPPPDELFVTTFGASYALP